MVTAEDLLAEMALELKSRSTVQIVGEAGSYGLLGLAIIAGNLLTLVIFRLNSRLHTASNVFVASLALTDLGVAVLAVPLGTSSLATSRWPFSDTACQYQGFVVLAMVAASTQTLGWMAVNRYFKVVKPAKYRRYFRLKSSCMIVALTWFLAVLAPLPYLFAGNKFVFHPSKFFCFIHMNSAPYTAFLVITYIVLPSAVMAFCYYKIFQTVRQHTSRFQQPAAHRGVTVEEIRITKTLFTIVLVYMLCWSPVLLIDLIDTFRGTWSLPRPAYMSYSFMGTVSSAVNPIIYGVMNKEFRREYRRALTCAHRRSAVAPQPAVAVVSRRTKISSTRDTGKSREQSHVAA